MKMIAIMLTIFTMASPVQALSEKSAEKLLEFANKNYVSAFNDTRGDYAVYNLEGKRISGVFSLYQHSSSHLAKRIALIGDKTLIVFGQNLDGPLGIGAHSEIVAIDQEGNQFEQKILDTSIRLTSVVAIDEKTVVFGAAKEKLIEAQIEKNTIVIKNQYHIPAEEAPVLEIFKTTENKLYVIKTLFQYSYGLSELSNSFEIVGSIDFKKITKGKSSGVAKLNLHYLSNNSFVFDYINNPGSITWFKSPQEFKTRDVAPITEYFSGRVLNQKQVLFMSKNLDIHAIDSGGNFISIPSEIEKLEEKYKNITASKNEKLEIKTPGCLPIYEDWSGVNWLEAGMGASFGVVVGVFIYLNPLFVVPFFLTAIIEGPQTNEMPEIKERDHLVLASKVVATSYMSGPMPEHEMIHKLVSPWRADLKNAKDIQNLVKSANENKLLCPNGEKRRPTILPEMIQKIIFNEL